MFWMKAEARWKSGGEMMAAHSAPIRFTEVQPSCRTTKRAGERGSEGAREEGREGRRGGWEEKGEGGSEEEAKGG